MRDTKYTQSEMEERERKAFSAGRDRIGGWWNNQITNYQYKSYEHYKGVAPQPRKPLFTTEDGKPVYEGGECWVVEKGEDYPYQWVQVVKEGMEDGLTLFSTEDAAYEYILMNKPCLSVNDVVDKIKRVCDGTFTDDYLKWNWVLGIPHDNPGNVINYLKELAKTKINQ